MTSKVTPLLAFLLRTLLFTLLATGSLSTAFAAQNIVNVYTWSQEIPPHIIAQFEKETGIKVNYSTFDSNEIMYAKLRALKHPVYDLIEPSSYYIDRLQHLGLLTKLDHSKLPGFANLDPYFTHPSYDPNSNYSVPFIWGITGLFINHKYFPHQTLQSWNDLVDQRYKNQLMFLDDAREVFSVALKMLGYSVNDKNPEHIHAAYLKLKTLMPNVRLFNSDAIISILVDEDAAVGMAWNGDWYKAYSENDTLQFIAPKDGFVIWVDNFAIPKDAPHEANAYKFLDYLLRPEVAAAVSESINYSTTNKAAKKLLPLAMQNNPALYPSEEVLKHGEFQTDIGDQAFGLFEGYWEQLKMMS